MKVYSWVGAGIMGGKDLTNQKFGRLTAIENIPEKSDGTHTYWRCRCDCGTEVIVRTDQLTRGVTKSCGCLNRDKARDTCIKRNTKHNLTHHPLYNIWAKIRERCEKKSSKAYTHYGARGIFVCKEWSRDFEPFYKWSIENGWHKGLEIDRIDNNGPYSPENCRWTTKLVQANNKTNNFRLEYNGQTHTLAEWCRELDLDYSLTLIRLRKLGWTVERAFTTSKTPTQPCKKVEGEI